MAVEDETLSMTVVRSAVLGGRMALYGREFRGDPSSSGKLMEFDLGDSEQCPPQVALLVAMASKGDLLHLVFEGGALCGAKLCVVEDQAVVAEIARGAQMPGSSEVTPLPIIDAPPQELPPVGLALPGLDAASLAHPNGVPSMNDWALGAQISSKAVAALAKAGKFYAGEPLELDASAKIAIEAFGVDLSEASAMVVGVASDMLRRQVSGAGPGAWREIFELAASRLDQEGRGRMHESLMGAPCDLGPRGSKPC